MLNRIACFMITSDEVQSKDKIPTGKKTTVVFPAEVIRELRQYLLDHDYTSHDQSRIIVDAVKKYLQDMKMRESSITYAQMKTDTPLSDEERFQDNTDDFGLKNTVLEQEECIDLASNKSHCQKDQKKELQTPSLR